MVQPSIKNKPLESKPFRVYTLTKSGSTRYLNIGTVLPKDWVVVKLTLEKLEAGVAILKLEQIK